MFTKLRLKNFKSWQGKDRDSSSSHHSKILALEGMAKIKTKEAADITNEAAKETAKTKEATLKAKSDPSNLPEISLVLTEIHKAVETAFSLISTAKSKAETATLQCLDINKVTTPELIIKAWRDAETQIKAAMKKAEESELRIRSAQESAKNLASPLSRRYPTSYIDSIHTAFTKIQKASAAIRNAMESLSLSPEDAIEIELAPVTLLLGTNSSGKSSLLQALLLLKQTANSPDRRIHINLGGGDGNDYFNFGSFEDVLNIRALQPQIDLGFDFSRPKNTKEPVAAGSLDVSFAIREKAVAVTIETLLLSNHEHKYQVARQEKGMYSVRVDDGAPRGTDASYAPERAIALPADAIALLGGDGALAEDISLSIRRELGGIAYLGPLRRKPERDYVWNKSKPGDLGMEGSGVVNALFASALLRVKEQGNDASLIKEVSKWLERMGVADKLEVVQLGRSTRYEIFVHKDGIKSNLHDVGTGVSQVLPVITLAFFAPVGSTILLEEPEIHLHPLAQAVLADLFVEVSQKRQVQFIVETHSEHLFRRMQTLAARETLKREHCRMYFVKRGETDSSVITSLQLDEYGRVSDWPDRFFGDVLGETREQARLMFERKKQELQT